MLSVTALLRNKVLAIRLGVAGFGEYSQIGLVAGWLFVVASFGLTVGLGRNTAVSRSTEERQKHLSTANALIGILGLLVLIGGAALTVGLSRGAVRSLGIERDATHVIALAILVVSAPLEALKNNYVAFLQGMMDVKALSIRRGMAVLVGTGVSIPLVWYFGLVGAAVQSVLLTGVLVITLARRCRQLGYRPLSLRLDRASARTQVALGGASLASGCVQSLCDVSVRALLISGHGAGANGLFQAALMLSYQVKSVVLGGVGGIALANAGIINQSRSAASSATNRMLRVVLPVASISLAAVGLMGRALLSVLFSREFGEAAAILPVMLLADLVQAYVWVIGAPILVGARIWLWLAVDMSYAMSRWVLCVVLIPRYGALAVALGYCGGIVVEALVARLVVKKAIGVEIDSKRSMMLLQGAFVVVCVSTIGASYWDDLRLMSLAGIVWLGWLAFVVAQEKALVMKVRSIALRVRR